MTTRAIFRRMLQERRFFPATSLEWEWRTRAARTLAWMIRGKPAQEWTE